MSRKLAAGPKINLREPEVKAEVTALLRRLGCHTHSTSDGRPARLTAGIPDLLVFPPNGRPFFFFECKSESGTLSKAQEAFRYLCYQSGTGWAWGGVVQVMAHLRKIRAIA